MEKETVSIYKEDFFRFVEMAGRINALRDFMKVREYISPDGVSAILGFSEKRGAVDDVHN